MTEDEAKKRWCPFARTYSYSLDGATGVTTAAASINRLGLGPDRDCLCLASGCMAWRLDPPYVDRVGHCGLAGKVDYE